MNRVYRIFGGLAIFSIGGGCHYRFQSSYNPWYVKEKIETVYLAPILNDSYVEELGVTLYNQLFRTFLLHQTWRLVRDSAGADAVLQGVITQASTDILVQTRVLDLVPQPLGKQVPVPERLVPSQYQAILEARFELRKGDRVLWSSTFRKTQPFQASWVLGVTGNTSALRHHAEWTKTLTELTQGLSESVHESLLGGF